MKQTFYIAALLLGSVNLFSQAGYTGLVGKYPIELVADVYPDGKASAIYAYSNFDEPIVINGSLQNGTLTLFEKDMKKKNSSALVFNEFNASSTKLEGTWTDFKTKKQLKIVLTKMFDLSVGESAAWMQREIIQPVSLNNKYFKLVISKATGDFYPKVSAVKILEKKTDKLLQKLSLDCELRGLDNIDIGDYNFDGVEDFSVFEASYAGPNTSRVYFLYDTKANNFFDSGFSGTSLAFNASTKTIFERNQCCAGTVVTTAEYKVANNKMVLLRQHCYKWDENKQELVERDIKECQ